MCVGWHDLECGVVYIEVSGWEWFSFLQSVVDLD